MYGNNKITHKKACNFRKAITDKNIKYLALSTTVF